MPFLDLSDSHILSHAVLTTTLYTSTITIPHFTDGKLSRGYITSKW